MTDELQTIEPATLTDVIGGDGNPVEGLVDWAKEKGGQVIDHFFPRVQGNADLDAGPLRAQGTFNGPPLPQLPPLSPR